MKHFAHFIHNFFNIIAPRENLWYCDTKIYEIVYMFQKNW